MRRALPQNQFLRMIENHTVWPPKAHSSKWLRGIGASIQALAMP